MKKETTNQQDWQLHLKCFAELSNGVFDVALGVIERGQTENFKVTGSERREGGDGHLLTQRSALLPSETKRGQ